MVNKPAGRRVVLVFMHPSLAASGRVVRVKDFVSVTAAQRCLIDAADVFKIELISLFVPNKLKKAFAESQRLHLDRIIRTAKYDFLSSRL